MLKGIHEALLIVNSRALERARKILASRGIATEHAVTDAPGAAAEIARRLPQTSVLFPTL